MHKPEYSHRALKAAKKNYSEAVQTPTPFLHLTKMFIDSLTDKKKCIHYKHN